VIILPLRLSCNHCLCILIEIVFGGSMRKSTGNGTANHMMRHYLFSLSPLLNNRGYICSLWFLFLRWPARNKLQSDMCQTTNRLTANLFGWLLHQLSHEVTRWQLQERRTSPRSSGGRAKQSLSCMQMLEKAGFHLMLMVHGR
jgi:hypothetical protein